MRKDNILKSEADISSVFQHLHQLLQLPENE